jgi:hypothetical protein
MGDQSIPPEPLAVIDLAGLSVAAHGGGPQWAQESGDLDLTFLSWAAGQGVAAHANDEVDVLLIVAAGAADVTIAARTYRVSSGQALLIPKGVERAITCATERVSYLSVHRRRRGLWPTLKGRSLGGSAPGDESGKA